MNFKCNGVNEIILSLNEIFPVGSIYISMKAENPATYLGGGVWTNIGQGKTLVGVDPNDSDFNAVEKTGGEKTHTLVKEELPQHEHYFGTTQTTGNPQVKLPQWAMLVSYQGQIPTEQTRFGLGCKLQLNDKMDLPHNNLQPYITTYIWKRTA